jgi:hypothetical protein
VIDHLYREKGCCRQWRRWWYWCWHGMAAMPSFRSWLVCFTFDRKHTDGSPFSPFCCLQISGRMASAT